MPGEKKQDTTAAVNQRTVPEREIRLMHRGKLYPTELGASARPQFSLGEPSNQALTFQNKLN